jgi:hypothetical protein
MPQLGRAKSSRALRQLVYRAALHMLRIFFRFKSAYPYYPVTKFIQLLSGRMANVFGSFCLMFSICAVQGILCILLLLQSSNFVEV